MPVQEKRGLARSKNTVLVGVNDWWGRGSYGVGQCCSGLLGRL
jgi:hypothetical protein